MSESELPCIRNGSEVIEIYDFNEENFWTNVISMAVIYTAFHILGYLFLWRRCQTK